MSGWIIAFCEKNAAFCIFGGFGVELGIMGIGLAALGAWYGNKEKPPPIPPEIFANAGSVQELAKALRGHYERAAPELARFSRGIRRPTERAAGDFGRARLSALELAGEYEGVARGFGGVAEQTAEDLRTLGDLDSQGASAERARLGVLAGADDSTAGRRLMLARRGIEAGGGAGAGESTIAGGLAGLAGAQAAEAERMHGESARIHALPATLQAMELPTATMAMAGGYADQEANAWARGASRLAGVHGQIQGLNQGVMAGFGNASALHADAYNARVTDFNAKQSRRRNQVNDFVNIMESMGKMVQPAAAATGG